jgi:hypothetical protein
LIGKLQALLAAPRAVPLLLRHLAAYAELAAGEVAAAATDLQRRLVLGAVAAMAGLLSLALAVTWLVAATWDTPWRLWTIGGLALGFALIALGAARSAGRAPSPPFAVLKEQWAADSALLERAGLLDSQRRDAHAP